MVLGYLGLGVGWGFRVFQVMGGSSVTDLGHLGLRDLGYLGPGVRWGFRHLRSLGLGMAWGFMDFEYLGLRIIWELRIFRVRDGWGFKDLGYFGLGRRWGFRDWGHVYIESKDQTWSNISEYSMTNALTQNPPSTHTMRSSVHRSPSKKSSKRPAL